MAKSFGRYLLLFLFCSMAALVSAQVKSSNVQVINGAKYYIHKVDKGQSLYAISKLYAVSLDELYRVNPELKNGAKVGQQIKIPFAPQPAVTAAPASTVTQIDTIKYLTYKVGKLETIYSLSKKFNLTEKQLLAYNPVLSQGIKEGQTIIVGERSKRKSVPVKDPKELKPIFTAKEKPLSIILDSTLYTPVSKPIKPVYTVALILPFKLNQTLSLELNDLVKTNTNFPSVPALAVDFYLGFKWLWIR